MPTYAKIFAGTGSGKGDTPGGADGRYRLVEGRPYRVPVGVFLLIRERSHWAGIPIRHIDLERNVPMYVTNRQCRSAGRLSGHLVVSMRPILTEQLGRAVTRTALYPAVHGAPVHTGDHPAIIGIKDILKPDSGEIVPIEGEVPVFWTCGVTPQAALMASRPPVAIIHAPEHMFIADSRDEEYAMF